MSLSSDRQQKLSEFVSMTNADVDVAKKFLAYCSWNTNIAIDRFFTFGGDVSKLAPPTQNIPRPVPIQQQPQPQANALSALMGFFGGGNNNPQPQPMSYQQPQQIPFQQQPQQIPPNNNNNNNMSQYDADALLAQQLSAQSQPKSPQIRAPDQGYTEQLVGPYSNFQSMRQQRRDRQANFAKDWERGPKNPKSSFLGALFSDPEYKFKGSWEEAKKKGVFDNRWVLVNIQDTENFVSHCLNRDIWKGKELEDVIKESFILYQWTKETDNGRRVMNLYHINQIPTVLVIDPNTGREEHKFKIPSEPDKISQVKDQILEFLDDYPNPKTKKKKVITHAPSSKQQAPVTHDDELLQAAIAASLGGGGGSNNNNNNNNNNNKSNNINKKEEKESAMDVDVDDNDKDKEEPPKSPQEELILDPQPDKSDPNGTAIRIRMPNGSVLQRRFNKDSKVQQLYIWLILSLNDGKQVSLIQAMPRMSLNDQKDKTLKELGLIRATLVCSYDDD